MGKKVPVNKDTKKCYFKKALAVIPEYQSSIPSTCVEARSHLIQPSNALQEHWTHKINKTYKI